MKKHVVRIFVYGSMVVTAIATAFVPRSWAVHHGLDVWNVPKLESQIEESAARYEEMDKETQVVLEHIEERDAVALELLFGHMDLMEAARRFREMNSADPDRATILQLEYPGMNDNECVCQNVIEYAGRIAVERPELTPALQQLRRQFDSMRHRKGGFDLDF